MIKLLRAKLRRNEPYVGIFLKRDSSNDKDVVENLDDIYDIGTFAQIHEVKDLGDQIKLVATAHRRIKIKQQIRPDVNLSNNRGWLILSIWSIEASQ